MFVRYAQLAGLGASKRKRRARRLVTAYERQLERGKDTKAATTAAKLVNMNVARVERRAARGNVSTEQDLYGTRLYTSPDSSYASALDQALAESGFTAQTSDGGTTFVETQMAPPPPPATIDATGLLDTGGGGDGYFDDYFEDEEEISDAGGGGGGGGGGSVIDPATGLPVARPGLSPLKMALVAGAAYLGWRAWKRRKK